MDTTNTIYRKSSQLLGYADDLDLAGRNVDIVKEEYTNLSGVAGSMGLEVNEDKTKYLVTTSSKPRPTVQALHLSEKSFEAVDNFVYLGSQVNSDNSRYSVE